MDHEELMDKLGERIKENYAALEQRWLRESSVPDILADAEWVAAVKIIAENYKYCVSYDAATELLKIQNPLDALADIWVSQTDNNVLEMPELVDHEIDHDWLMDYEDYEQEGMSEQDAINRGNIKETMEKSDVQIENTPMYRHSAEYAVQHGEAFSYYESFNANLACAEAIEKAVGDNYHDYCLDSKATISQVGRKFGMERFTYVLANTVQCKAHDGRISERNKRWAETIPVAEDTSVKGENRNLSFVVDRVNPGLIDLLVNQVRKTIDRERIEGEKKPSILEKIKQHAVSAPCSETKKTRKETVL